ncbi:MAG: GAF domain-containing protein [Acidobacteriota bacterium]
MHSRPLRFMLVVACACGIGAAAVFIRSLDDTRTARRAALRYFDRLAWDATDAVAELRAAQQAYLAIGQGPDFWMSKVDATSQRLSAGLTNLQPVATSATARSALDQAVAASTEFSNVDGRIRGYLRTGAQSIAAQIVFAEGGRVTVETSQHIEQARLEEHLEFDRFEADSRKLEMAAAGGSVGFLLLVSAVLALVTQKSASDTEPAALALNLSAAGGRQVTAEAPASAHDLPLRAEVQPVAVPRTEIRRPERLPPHPAPVPLQAVAQICTDMGRIGDPEELKGLLSRAAEALDASGLVLWLGTSSGSELRPALAHGYTPEMVSRIPVVPRAANNAAAAAYRSGILQIVLSKSGSPAKGAVVAPVLSAEGCLGVLSAEIRGGGEASETVQSLAAIFAAQLAGVVASTPVVPERAAAVGGAGS